MFSATHTRLHIFSFLHVIWLTISSLYSMEFMCSEFPGHSRMGIPLLSGNCLLLLESWHDARSCIKIHPFCMGYNALTCHFNIMNNITLVFYTIHVTIHLSQMRHASVANGSSDLHTYWRFYFSLNTLSMIFLILFGPDTTITLVVMTVKYRLM